MYNRTWRIVTQMRILDEEGKTKGENLPGAREVKNFIYSTCQRGKEYMVEEYEPKSGELINAWVYKYQKEGPIFTRNIYNKLKEIKEKAKANQLKINEL